MTFLNFLINLLLRICGELTACHEAMTVTIGGESVAALLQVFHSALVDVLFVARLERLVV